MISQYVGKNHRHWDRHCRSTIRLQHRAPRRHRVYLCVPQPRQRVPRTAVVALIPPDINHRRLEEAHEVVQMNLARVFQRQAHHYNLRRRDWKPNVDDEVWKRAHQLSNKRDAINAKLAPKYIGPLTVRKIISPVIVDLRSPQGKWYRHIHVQDIKPTTKDDDEYENDQ